MIASSDEPRPLSYSAVRTYFTCGEKYRRQYVEREFPPPGAAAIAGAAVHGAAEAYYRRKRDAREELSVDEVRDAAATSFDARLAKDDVTLDYDEKAIGRERVLSTAKDKSVRLAALHRVELAPTVEPDLIEERIEVEIPGLHRRLVGVVDLATKPAADGEGGDIIDLKTSTRRMSQEDANRSLQLTVYGVLYEALTGLRSRRVVLHEVVDTQKPQANVIVSERTDDDRHALAAYLEAAECGIAAGHFPPAAPGAWWCSEKWCAFAPTCKYFPRNRLHNGG